MKAFKIILILVVIGLIGYYFYMPKNVEAPQTETVLENPTTEEDAVDNEITVTDESQIYIDSDVDELEKLDF